MLLFLSLNIFTFWVNIKYVWNKYYVKPAESYREEQQNDSVDCFSHDFLPAFDDVCFVIALLLLNETEFYV